MLHVFSFLTCIILDINRYFAMFCKWQLLFPINYYKDRKISRQHLHFFFQKWFFFSPQPTGSPAPCPAATCTTPPPRAATSSARASDGTPRWGASWSTPGRDTKCNSNSSSSSSSTSRGGTSTSSSCESRLASEEKDQEMDQPI